MEHFDTLFPGWQICDTSTPGVTNSMVEGRLKGVQYHTDAGKPDILCLDSKNNFVVIELKRDKAPDTVIAQLDRYIAYVQKRLAQPGQRVRGLIIAKSLDNHLKYTLSRRRNIEFWTYDWHLQFDKKVFRRMSGQKVHPATSFDSREEEITASETKDMDDNSSDQNNDPNQN